jgi:hypothetical protein
MLTAALILPAVTVALTQLRPSLTLIDAVLIYLLIVIGVSLIGGFCPRCWPHWPPISS